MKIVKNHTLNINNYNIIRKINEGTYGCVYCIEDKKNNQKLAAKVIRETMTDQKLINREIEIMIRLQHPTIIKFYGYSLKDFEGNDRVSLIMELAERGSLQDLLDKARHGTIDEFYDNTIRQKILIGISRGMMHLHSNNVIHRDLKPGNILLDGNFEPHIADFGSSKISNNLKIKSQTQSVGTYLYLAPEAISSTHYDNKVDVYSFGIIMYEIITETLPYEEMQTDEMTTFNFLQKVVDEDLRPKFKVPVKESFLHLITQCWSKNPSDRPTFEEIYNKLTLNTYDYGYNAFDDDEKEKKYFLENVDEDEIFYYIENINKNSTKDNIEIDQIKKNHQKEIDYLNHQYQHQINEIKENHQKEIIQLKRKNQNELNSKEEEINRLQREHQIEIDQQNNVHQKEIIQLKRKNQIEIDQQNNVHQKEIIQLKRKNQNELISKEDEINRLKREHQAEIMRIRTEITNQSIIIKNQQTYLNEYQNEIKRLNEIIVKSSSSSPKEIISIQYSKGREFQGIINYFIKNSNVYKEIDINSSSLFDNDPTFSPFNVIKYNDLNADFHTKDFPNSWICFYFKNHQIVPKNYTIRTFGLDRNASHLKSWVVEGMNSKNKWMIIDCQNDCEYLNGRNFMKTFTINNPKNLEFEIIRIRQTGPNWRGRDFLKINSIEFYGMIH